MYDSILITGGAGFVGSSLALALKRWRPDMRVVVCEEITGHRIPWASVPDTRPADVRLYISDHEVISKVNAWRPRRDARATLTDIFQWLNAEESHVRPLFVSS